MKNIALITCLIMMIIPVVTFAQAPQAIQYQAVVRDGNGDIVTSQPVSFQMSIYSGSASGTLVYSETHSVTTNSFGLVTFSVGTGTVVSGDFITIAWSSGLYFLKVEADITGGTAYVDMGTTQLLSVPYALYAEQSSSSINDNDPDPANELQVLTVSNDTLYLSNGGFVSLAGYSDTLWRSNGADIYNTNAGKVGIGITTPPGKLVVQGDSSMADTVPLFEVKDRSGATVFIVYPDSARFYVGDDGSKTNKGAFAVSGRNTAKQLTNNFLWVTPDSTRIYLDSSSTMGGFAIQSHGHGNNKNFLDVSVDTGQVINPSQSRIVWYPTKSSFLTGKVLIESPDSVGTNSFASGYESKAVGNWSQALGYMPVARGDYSTAIGKYAIANGLNSYAFGDSAKAMMMDSYAFGAGATASGLASFAIGSVGRDSIGFTGQKTIAQGDYSFAFGSGCKSTNTGAFTVGFANQASGPFSQALGYYSTATGWYSVSIGNKSNAGGESSTSIGWQSDAPGYGSMALGSSIANGTYSTAIGEGIANGTASYAMGYVATSDGVASSAFGYRTTAESYKSTVVGSNNVSTGGSATGWVRTDPIFIVGNGSGTPTWPPMSSNAMTILKNGNIGFTETNPVCRLSIWNPNLGSTAGSEQKWVEMVAADGNWDYLDIIHRRHTATGDWKGAEIRIQRIVDVSKMHYISFKGTPSWSSLEFGMDNTAQMTLDENGSLGIGTTNPDFAKLQVEAPGNNIGVTRSGVGRWNIGLWSTNTFGIENMDPGVALLRVSSTGTDEAGYEMFRPGTVSTDYRMANIAGVVYFQRSTDDFASITDKFVIGNTSVRPGEDNVSSCGTAAYRWTTVYAFNGTINTSDAREKENINDISYGLDEVLKLKPVSFTWKKRPQDGKKLGFLAQDVEKVIKEVVVKEIPKEELEDGTIVPKGEEVYGMYYSDLIPVLVKSIQELNEEVSALKKEIETIKNK